MKTAAKVFLILAIIGAAFNILIGAMMGTVMTWFSASTEFNEAFDEAVGDSTWTVDGEEVDVDPEFTGMVASLLVVVYAAIFIISGILCLIFAIIALVQMKTRKPGVGISVCVLLFCNLLAGIFLLCSKPEEYGEAPVAPAAPNNDEFTYSV